MKDVYLSTAQSHSSTAVSISMTGSTHPSPMQTAALFHQSETSIIHYIRPTSAVSGLSSLVFTRFLFALTWSIDAVINCNVLYLSRAFLNATFNYEFAADPGYHAMDLCWTFYPISFKFNGTDFCKWPESRPQQFQSYIVSFVKHGDPNTDRNTSIPPFQLFGTEKNYIQLKWLKGFKALAPDTELPEERCEFWQSASYR